MEPTEVAHFIFIYNLIVTTTSRSSNGVPCSNPCSRATLSIILTDFFHATVT